jgi:hypothetical protein
MRCRCTRQAQDEKRSLNTWVGTFAGACRRAVDDAASFETRVEQIQHEWRAQVGRIRSGSSTDLLLKSLVGAPVVTVGSAADLIGRSFPQTNEAIERLVSAGVLSQVRVSKRNRVFEAPAIINAFTDLERQLASPAGDTRKELSATATQGASRIRGARAADRSGNTGFSWFGADGRERDGSRYGGAGGRVHERRDDGLVRVL